MMVRVADAAQIREKLLEGFALQQQGDLARAAASYREVLAMDPANFDALQLSGVIAAQTGELSAAAALMSQAVAVNPDNAPAHYNLGYIREELKDYAGALKAYDNALGAQPGHVLAHNNRGIVLSALSRPGAACESFDRAIALQPDFAEAHNNRAYALAALGRRADAVAAFARAIALKPDYAEAFKGRGSALAEMRQYAAALADYDKVLTLQPAAEVWNNRGVVLSELGRHSEALASYVQAAALKPDYAEAHYNQGLALNDLMRPGDAAACFARAAALQPDYPFLTGARLHTLMRLCDWRNHEADIAALKAGLERGARVSAPLAVIAALDSPALQRRVAEIWTEAVFPRNDALGPIAPRARGGKIRIGYFSTDFRLHPLALLTAGLFEAHDRAKFEVYAFSCGPDTGDAMRRRLDAAFDRFIDIRHMTDTEAAALARASNLDIAVDLAGHTIDARTGVFALRVAPVQVSYLGYPATMGADYIDYLLADGIVVPGALHQHYAEQVVTLPQFQANDHSRSIAARAFTRAECGLPEAGFVYCCFNNGFKITPDVFDSWMRILSAAPGSVLLLNAENTEASSNLRREAAARGIDPARLVFAPRLPVPEYLARFSVADLFLDTLPFNAGTTASDALWTGLPVLTRAGEAFAARMAASLLASLGLPELVTDTAAAYEALAIALARDPARLGDIRQRLALNRMSGPLFDIAAFARHLEGAYTIMVDLHRAGRPPEPIVVGRL